MRVIIQRSLNSNVRVDGEIIGEIDRGVVLLVGVTHEDTQDDVAYLSRKVANMRLFEDEESKVNLSLSDVGGEILSISQFTLYGNTKKGNRPSFTNAAKADLADQLYEKFNQALREYGYKVETGQFGANMELKITNDGPVTILLDSKNRNL
ncbi:D-tyrosyl-tRNA(Tyr) deacylase [Aerococcaceae bacterium DSM 111021]|nr:D-tyrosyl-tRNA(Tyr) deacylase [Aerococcaceae bacterium DSM 111021]